MCCCFLHYAYVWGRISLGWGFLGLLLPPGSPIIITKPNWFTSFQGGYSPTVGGIFKWMTWQSSFFFFCILFLFVPNLMFCIYYYYSSKLCYIWKDSANCNGGKWIIRFKKAVAGRFWEDLVKLCSFLFFYGAVSPANYSFIFCSCLLVPDRRLRLWNCISWTI